MNTFRIIFAKNKIVSCELEKDVTLDKEYHYEHNKGNLMFALVNAADEEEAVKISDKIVNEVNDKVFGNDFIN